MTDFNTPDFNALAIARLAAIGITAAPKSLYLAGPDVFFPEVHNMANGKKAMLARWGLTGLAPLDTELDLQDLAPLEAGSAISAANETLMQQADGIIANGTPYHGPSMDVGTAFETGYMRALGKPVFIYSNDARSFAKRVGVLVHNGKVITDDNGRLWGPDQSAIENFDMADNLMMHGAALASGGGYFTHKQESPALARGNLIIFGQAAKAAALHFYGADIVAALQNP